MRGLHSERGWMWVAGLPPCVGYEAFFVNGYIDCDSNSGDGEGFEVELFNFNDPLVFSRHCAQR